MTNCVYSIGVVARMLGISQQTIRQYEERGLITPKRSSGNTRLFTDEDVEILKMIQHLTQELGVNLAGAELIIKLNKELRTAQRERDLILKMLFEAGEMVRSMIDKTASNSPLIRSVIGNLIRYSDSGQ